MLLLKSISKILILLLILFCFLSSNLSAQYWNSARDYEPIIMQGSDFSQYVDQPVSQIFAYSYNQAQDSWTQIPIQIDEKDDSTHVWVPTPNNVLNNNDEIVFMARDMGDQVPSTDKWIDDEDSRNYERYEITATDPNDGGKQAFVYFYQSSTITDVTSSYMNYTAADGNGADIITGVSYIEGHTVNGIPDYWEIPVEAGGSGVDILDILKLRINAVYQVFDLKITEAWLIFVKFDNPIQGKIRVCRRIWLRDFLGFYTFNIPMYYYPYSIYSKGASMTLDPSEIQVSLIRQSFDLLPSAANMRFHNNENTDIIIDGISDAVVPNLVFKPNVNWFLITGSQGTVLTLTELTELGTTGLYYHDNSSGGTADGTTDTGDSESWCDNGIMITGTNLAGRFSISYLNYFLSKDQSATIGPEFASNFTIPLNIIQNSQMVPVEMRSFEASVSEDQIILSWTTVSESNNYGFDVQRKTASNDYWETIGFVAGAGTNNSPKIYNYIDEKISENHYFYRLKQIDFDGSADFSSTIEVFIQSPKIFQLIQNYPNPFNPETVISYQIPELKGESVEVELVIFNLLGDEVRTLVQKNQGSGYYNLMWDGRDNSGKTVTAGTYVYQIKAGKFIQSKKMTLLR